jgi:hypothetical protein
MEETADLRRLPEGAGPTRQEGNRLRPSGVTGVVEALVEEEWVDLRGWWAVTVGVE